jgi:hypothetical protein
MMYVPYASFLVSRAPPVKGASAAMGETAQRSTPMGDNVRILPPGAPVIEHRREDGEGRSHVAQDMGGPAPRRNATVSAARLALRLQELHRGCPSGPQRSDHAPPPPYTRCHDTVHLSQWWRGRLTQDVLRATAVTDIPS